MSEENKAVMRRFYEEFINAGNLAVAEKIIAPDCQLHFGSMSMGAGPEAFKQTRVMMYASFPDIRWTIEEMIAEGDKVAERLTARGTHEGEFMDVATTGKRVEFQGIATVRIREGKISENGGMPDMLGLLQQLGAVPRHCSSSDPGTGLPERPKGPPSGQGGARSAASLPEEGASHVEHSDNRTV